MVNKKKSMIIHKQVNDDDDDDDHNDVDDHQQWLSGQISIIMMMMIMMIIITIQFKWKKLYKIQIDQHHHHVMVIQNLFQFFFHFWHILYTLWYGHQPHTHMNNNQEWKKKFIMNSKYVKKTHTNKQMSHICLWECVIQIIIIIIITHTIYSLSSTHPPNTVFLPTEKKMTNHKLQSKICFSLSNTINHKPNIWKKTQTHTPESLDLWNSYS